MSLTKNRLPAPDHVLEEIKLLRHEVNDRLNKMDGRFDDVIYRIQEAMGGVYELAKDNARKLQENLEPRVEKLEKHVFASPV